MSVNDVNIVRESNKTTTDNYIELFDLDLQLFDRGVFRFTTSYPNEMGKVISFNQHEYMSLPIKAEGFEWSGTGQAPRPKLSLSTINPITASMITTYNDLVGATVTRIRTFEKFLDNGSTPNPAARFQEDIFKVERKAQLHKYAAEFELVSVVDQENQYLPKNKVTKFYCSYIYRYHDKNSFVYDKFNPCPYKGNDLWNRKNEKVPITSPWDDCCSKTLDGCKLRFKNRTLPFQGFPGVKRG